MNRFDINRASYFIKKSVKAWNKHHTAQQEENVTKEEADSALILLKWVEHIRSDKELRSTIRNCIIRIMNELNESEDGSKNISLYSDKLKLESFLASLK